MPTDTTETRPTRPAREWTVGASTFRAQPDVGARLMEWTRDGTSILLWPDDSPAPWEKIRGGNPILFPFAGRTFEGDEEGRWSWEGVSRPMPRHGFARAGRFVVTSESDDGFVAELEPTDDDHAAYPFEYVFEVAYRFAADAFEVDLTLRNTGTRSIPWSAGHHFYFSLPVATRNDVRVQVLADKAWYHGPDGQLVPTSSAPSTALSEPALVDRIHTHLQTPSVTFGPVPGAPAIRISVLGDQRPSDWTTFVTWTQSDDSAFYCVEPWMGPPNGPGHGLGLHIVEPGHAERFKVRVEAID